MATHGNVSPGKFAPAVEKGGINVVAGMITSLPHPTVHTMELATA